MKIKNIIAALALPGAVALAASPQIDRIETGRDGSRMYLNMTLNPKDMRHGTNTRLELIPVITSADSTHTAELPPVILAGTNMYYSTMRNGTPEQLAGLHRAGRGEPINYAQSVPYEDWMEVCTVDLQARATGCCGAEKGPDQLYPIAEIDLRRHEFEPDFVYMAPLDTAEKRFDLSGRANIRFIVNRTNIDWSYANNYVELDSILRTVNAVKDNPDASVESITLTGFASPEGPYDNNVRLAKGRTEVVKEYVRANASFPASVYHTASVPEDWGGLREWLLTCNLDNREAMIAFIDDPNVPVRTKNEEFMRRFPKEYPFILANVYPPLRHTDYRITYTVRKYLTVEEIRQVFETRPRNLSLNEFYLLANSYEPGSPEYDDVFAVAVQMYPDDEIANLNAANSAINRGQWARAEQFLTRAGDVPLAIYGRGVLLAKQGKYDEALPWLEKAREAGVAQAEGAIAEIGRSRSTVNGVHYINRELDIRR